jgi:hypothetical protein
VSSAIECSLFLTDKLFAALRVGLGGPKKVAEMVLDEMTSSSSSFTVVALPSPNS